MPNSGNYNSGNYNSGNYNSGNYNSGYWNSGYWNSGNYNSGHYNSGYWNSGNYNSGNRNSGNWNSGNWNSGYWNSGYWNSGNYNSGNRNSGNYNSGNYNSGNRNSGNYNSGNYNSGYFCTDTPKVRIFNKETDLPREDIVFPDFFSFNLTEWVDSSIMTSDEKKDHPLWKTTGGYLKTYGYKEAWKKSWDKASEADRKKVFDLPNFDAKIFEEITGINVYTEDKVTIHVEGKEIQISRESAKALNLVD
jgi:hypothetical protein